MKKHFLALSQFSKAELDAIFASAPHVFTETFRQHRQSQVPMEPHGIIVRWNPHDHEMHVWSSCQRVPSARSG